MSLADHLRDALRSAPASPPLEGDLPDELAADHRSRGRPDRRDRPAPSPGVILTVRREHMRTHAGQVAFPAAASIPAKMRTAAALREAWEELGLEPETAEVVGDGRPLSDRHRLCRDARARGRRAGPAAQPARA